MTVYDFFNNYNGMAIIDVELFEVNENVLKVTNSEQIILNELSEEWVEAEIQDWHTSDDIFCMSVIK